LDQFADGVALCCQQQLAQLGDIGIDALCGACDRGDEGPRR
jgi:hypothetical protein